MNERTLITELHNSVATIGLHKTIQVLKNGRNKQLNDDGINYIFTEVNKMLCITIEQLQSANSRSDLRELRKVAIGFYIYFSCTVLGYKFKDVQKCLPVKFEKTVLYRYYRLIKNAKTVNPKTDIDKLVVMHLENLKTIFSSNKNLNNNKNVKH